MEHDVRLDAVAVRDVAHRLAVPPYAARALALDTALPAACLGGSSAGRALASAHTAAHDAARVRAGDLVAAIAACATGLRRSAGDLERTDDDRAVAVRHAGGG